MFNGQGIVVSHGTVTSLIDPFQLSVQRQSLMSIRTSNDVFICHASEDKESIVNPIKVACREIGISTWVDDDEIQWGDSITKRVQAGLVNSQLVLVVISESSIAKNWPDMELSAAIHLEMASTGVRVLPLLCGSKINKDG